MGVYLIRIPVAATVLLTLTAEDEQTAIGKATEIWKKGGTGYVGDVGGGAPSRRSI